MKEETIYNSAIEDVKNAVIHSACDDNHRRYILAILFTLTKKVTPKPDLIVGQKLFACLGWDNNKIKYHNTLQKDCRELY